MSGPGACLCKHRTQECFLQSLHPKPLPWLGYFKAGQVCHTSTRLVVINFQMLQVLCAEVNGGTSVHTYVRNLPWALYVGVSHIHTYTRTNIPTHIHTYIHTYLHTYIPTYVLTYMHTQMCVYVYIHIYMYTNPYTHTETHAHSWLLFVAEVVGI